MYPRPMMVRPRWVELDGSWEFAADDRDAGLSARWFSAAGADRFTRTIQVPYPPESPASWIGDVGFHPIIWYRRAVPHGTLVPAESEPGSRVLLHFVAVDYRARVWCDGHLVADHVGAQTPFTADVTDALDPDAAEHVLVVRAEDDPADLAQPRGKQDWQDKPHGIWYERTTGIWQPVWTEIVPADHVIDTVWIPDLTAGVVRATVTLNRAPSRELLLDMTFRLGDE